MITYKLPFAITAIALLLLSSGSLWSPARAAAPTEPLQEDEDVIKRDLVLIGPAKDAMLRAGFNPSGSIKVVASEEELGVDKLKISIQGLPPKTDFTVFLHELSDIPFGSSQYLAEMHTNKAGRASITISTVIVDAFALKTAGNPPTQRLENVDLNFIAIWFADSKDDDAFTNFPSLAFDGDRNSGVVVLGTLEPLP
ncbi:MAG: hypothetical protein V7641_4788 [Blastocatellia bacterium]